MEERHRKGTLGPWGSYLCSDLALYVVVSLALVELGLFLIKLVGRLIKFSPRDASRRAWAPSAVYPRHGKASDDGIYDLIPEEEGFGPEVEAIKDPKEFVQMFKHSAQLMKEAGFDGVELHSGNGYLLAQVSELSLLQRSENYADAVL